MLQNNNVIVLFFSLCLLMALYQRLKCYEGICIDLKLTAYNCVALVYSLLQTVYFIFIPLAPQDCLKLPLWCTVGELLKRATLHSCYSRCTATDRLSENLYFVPAKVITELPLLGTLPFACALMTSFMTACLSITQQVCKFLINTVFSLGFHH